MKTDGVRDLELLNAAIQEAKFGFFLRSGNIAGDPELALLSNRIYDELSELNKKRKSGADLEELRRVKTSQGYRGAWRTAVLAARADKAFRSADEKERLTLAKCYLSPFTCTESELKEFLAAADMTDDPKSRSLDALMKAHSFDSAMLLSDDYSMSAQRARIVFMLKSRRVCDIFFSRVRRFELARPDTPGGEGEPDMPVVKKLSAGSKEKRHSLEAELTLPEGKMTLRVEAGAVDWWLS